MHPFDYTPNPLSPLEHRAARPASVYGAVNPITGLLGDASTQLAKSLLADPAIQMQIQEIQVECKEQAKLGVNEWAKENWGYLVAGAATLIGLNYLMLAVGVLPLVNRRR